MLDYWLQLFVLVGLGFVLGLKHALDADHVLTISAIVSETKSLRKSSLLGLIWGIGHTFTIFVLGLVFLILKPSVPQSTFLYFEFLVGFILLAFGLDILRKIYSGNAHLHKHKHGKLIHIHAHSHGNKNSHKHFHKPFFVGMIHGIAGSAALMLLVLSTTKTLFEGMTFILVFGLGSIIGMFLASIFIGLPFVLTTKFDGLNRFLKIGSSILSILLGIMIMYETGSSIV